MGYVKFFRSAFRINESTLAKDFKINQSGVVMASQADQYTKIPQLSDQMKKFEETKGISIGIGNTGGFELFVELIIAQLGSNNIKVDGGKGYTADIEAAIKSFQQEKKLPVTGKVDQSTYNVLFGRNPIVRGSVDSATKSTKKGSKDPYSMPDVIPYEKYKKLVALVIDKLEGGYYHPTMMDKQPKKFTEEVYGKSGETLFGLDRHAGHGYYYSSPMLSKDVKTNLANIESGKYKYITTDAMDFWTTVDTADAKNSWEWGDRGGSLEPKLRELAGKIIKPYFNTYFEEYLSEEVKPIVKGDDRLLFHFIYATWNGIKFWQKFAKKINDAYRSGKTSADELYELALESRLNSAVPKSGTIMIEIFGKPKTSKSISFKN